MLKGKCWKRVYQADNKSSISILILNKMDINFKKILRLVDNYKMLKISSERYKSKFACINIIVLYVIKIANISKK